jgi:hypothetical protein
MFKSILPEDVLKEADFAFMPSVLKLPEVAPNSKLSYVPFIDMLPELAFSFTEPALTVPAFRLPDVV